MLNGRYCVTQIGGHTADNPLPPFSQDTADFHPSIRPSENEPSKKLSEMKFRAGPSPAVPRRIGDGTIRSSFLDLPAETIGNEGSIEKIIWESSTDSCVINRVEGGGREVCQLLEGSLVAVWMSFLRTLVSSLFLFLRDAIEKRAQAPRAAVCCEIREKKRIPKRPSMFGLRVDNRRLPRFTGIPRRCSRNFKISIM